VYGPGVEAPQKEKTESWRLRRAATDDELDEQDRQEKELRAEDDDDWDCDWDE
jgi:hypothetical protein